MKYFTSASFLLLCFLLHCCAAPSSKNKQGLNKKPGGAHHIAHAGPKPKPIKAKQEPTVIQPEFNGSNVDYAIILLKEGILLGGQLGGRVLWGQEQTKQGKAADKKLLARLDRYRTEVQRFYGKTQANLQGPDLAANLARMVLKYYLFS